MSSVRIGVIGDYDTRLPYHPATTAAFEHAASALRLDARVQWVTTTRLAEPDGDELLSGFDALLASPGSP